METSALYFNVTSSRDDTKRYYSKEKRIGYLVGTYFDIIQAIKGGDDIYDMFDALSAEAADAYTAITDDGEINPDIVGGKRKCIFT